MLPSKDSDNIVVIADGDIQEMGTHAELLAVDGIYSALCEGQGLTAGAAGKSDEISSAVETNTSSTANTSIANGRNGDIEADAGNEELDEDENNDACNYKEINKRLRQFTNEDFWYSLLGYSGGILVGALPGEVTFL